MTTPKTEHAPVVALRTYSGRRDGLHNIVEVAADGEVPCPLDPRLDLAAYSTGGFEWGDSGDGASQLALAILADALGRHQENVAIAWHPDFRRDVIANLAFEGWTLTSIDVHKWIVQAGINLIRAQMRSNRNRLAASRNMD